MSATFAREAGGSLDGSTRPPPALAASDPTLTRAVAEATTLGRTRERLRSNLMLPDRRSGLLTGGSFLLLMGAW